MTWSLESQLPKDTAEDLARFRRAVAEGQTREVKEPGQPRTVHGPDGMRWFPQATEHGLTLGALMRSLLVGLSLVAGILAALAVTHAHPDRNFVVVGAVLCLALTVGVVVAESRREAKARADLAVGTFLLRDALMVADRGRYRVVRRSEIVDVGEVGRGTGHTEGQGRARFLAVLQQQADGTRWRTIGWRNHAGAKAIVEAWWRKPA